MKKLTIWLPESVMAKIEAEARKRNVSKSRIIRDCLSSPRLQSRQTSSIDAIRDLIGSVEGLPADLSARKKKYLRATGYGS